MAVLAQRLRRAASAARSARACAGSSPSERAVGIDGTSDSEVLFALVLDALDAGATPEAGAGRGDRRGARARRGPAQPAARPTAHGIVATTCGNSLFTLRDDGLAAGGVLVASEPLDDHAGWTEVPDGSIVRGHRRAELRRSHRSRPMEGPA